MTTDNDFATQRLTDCLARIDANHGEIGARLSDCQRDIQAAHDHMWEARRDMDHLDQVAMRQSIDQMMRSSDVLRAQAKKLKNPKSITPITPDKSRQGQGSTWVSSQWQF